MVGGRSSARLLGTVGVTGSGMSGSGSHFFRGATESDPVTISSGVSTVAVAW